MNSNTKGLLFIVLGVLSLLWFGYEAANHLSGRVSAEENAFFFALFNLLKIGDGDFVLCLRDNKF